MKVCPKCKKRRRASSFYVRSDGRLQCWCKSCILSNGKETGPTYRQSSSGRSKKMQRQYGVTLDEKMAMVKRQNGRCYICHRKAKKLCIDHCHDTGFVRGVLCWRCNQALGFFNDNSQSLQRAIEYLDRAWDAWEELSIDEQSLWWPFRGRVDGKARIKRIGLASVKPTLPLELQ